MTPIKLILHSVIKDIADKNWTRLISDKDLKAIEKAENKRRDNIYLRKR